MLKRLQKAVLSKLSVMLNKWVRTFCLNMMNIPILGILFLGYDYFKYFIIGIIFSCSQYFNICILYFKYHQMTSSLNLLRTSMIKSIII